MSSTKKTYESFNVDIINDKDPQVQLHQSKELTKDFLIGELNKNCGIKINIRLNITFMKQIEKVNVGFFKSNENDIETVISDAGNELINRISEWLSEGSGWVIKSVDKHEIDISKYKPLRGSSYLPLPEKIKKQRLIFKIKMIMNALDGVIWHSYFLLNKMPSGLKNIKNI